MAYSIASSFINAGFEQKYYYLKKIQIGCIKIKKKVYYVY